MLVLKNQNIKRRLLDMYKSANAGHVGVSLSACEILTFIKFYLMQQRDQMILSKGHAAALLYSVLAEAGEILEEEIQTFYKNNTTLPAHPPVNKFSSIPFATGSLGHGLSLAAGLAFAAQHNQNDKNVFCLTSDGEINEGSTWEAALFIQQHQLKNLFWFIDRNHWQGFGHTEEVMRLEPLDKKLESFGFKVTVIKNGNNFEELTNAIPFFSTSQPNAIIANTIKGNGWQRLANTLDCHYVPMTDADFLQLKNNL